MHYGLRYIDPGTHSSMIGNATINSNVSNRSETKCFRGRNECRIDKNCVTYDVKKKHPNELEHNSQSISTWKLFRFHHHLAPFDLLLYCS